MNVTLRNAVAAALFAGLAMLFGAPAASAHGGPIVLEVAGDGSHGVNVVATWKKDRHPVRDTVIGAAVATSTDGRSFGPVQLVSAPEGQNLYHVAQPLPTGEWRVTVTTTEPAETRKTVKVVARDIAAAAQPEQVAAPEAGQGAEAPVRAATSEPEQGAKGPVRAVAAEEPAGTADLTLTVVVVAVGVLVAVVTGVTVRRQLLRGKGPAIRS
ncbi:hypothetical protein [Nonomuraea pusilla]|uniref:CopC domain-containing protein n=1 Tax=Nonomuraea pusilla TaxID=46177 RepID=A0A1H7JR08_9ACTN|nr:hypothetical protein [Nonomuraea pusilla]SEK76277.1 hypothetical protein SAMN05660976_01187 [Nonomuraea pusilla]